MANFTEFEPVERLDADSLEQARRVGAPPPLLDLWARYGTGFVGPGGYLRIVDPVHYGAQLGEWFTDTGGAVPFMATGMGDLFVWQPTPDGRGIIRHVLYRIGDIRSIAADFDVLFSMIEVRPYQDAYLLRAPYDEAVARLGRPDLYEAFFYAPFLLLGGSPEAANLDRGDLSVSLTIFSQLVGKASLIPGQSPSA